jgi:thiol:disulfide interchange protein
MQRCFLRNMRINWGISQTLLWPCLMLFLFQSSSVLSQIPEGALSTSSKPLLAKSQSLVSPDLGILPAKDAFNFFALSSPSEVLLHFSPQEGYYLYVEKFTLTNAAGSALALEMPNGEFLEDEYFGLTEILREAFSLSIDVSESYYPLMLSYQGCREDIYCYPPQDVLINIPKPDF